MKPRGYRILPYAIKRIIDEHFPDMADDETFLSRMKSGVLPYFDPNNESPLYERLLRAKIAFFAKGPSQGLLHEVEEIIAALEMTRDVFVHAYRWADILHSELHGHTINTVDQRLMIYGGGGNIRQGWPPEWRIFVEASGWLEEDIAKRQRIIQQHLLPHYVPELLEQSVPEYMEYMHLRAKMYLDMKPAYKVLVKAKLLRERLSRTEDVVDLSTYSIENELLAVRDKLDEFIEEIRLHLRDRDRLVAEALMSPSSLDQ